MLLNTDIGVVKSGYLIQSFITVSENVKKNLLYLHNFVTNFIVYVIWILNLKSFDKHII